MCSIRDVVGTLSTEDSWQGEKKLVELNLHGQTYTGLAILGLLP